MKPSYEAHGICGPGDSTEIYESALRINIVFCEHPYPGMYKTSYDTRLFAELYDVQPQAIVWMQPVWTEDGKQVCDFKFVYANEEGLKYLELSPEQLESAFLTHAPALTSELRRSVFEEVLSVYTMGKKSETTVFNAALNKYARALHTRLRDGVLTVIQDITRESRMIRQLEQQTQQLEEQKRQIAEQKKLLDNILENTSNGISVSRVFRNEAGEVVDALTILANDAAVRYIGLPKDIYLSKKATEIEPEVMHSPYYQLCIKTLETGEPFVTQYRMASTGRWLDLTVSRLDAHHLIQVFTDVTQVKEAQTELERAARTMKTIFDSAQTGMFTFAPERNEAGEIIDFRFVMVNSTVAGYAGQQSGGLEGELGIKWFPGYLTNGEFDMYKRCFETGEPQRREIHYVLDGHDYYLDLQCVQIGDQLLVSLVDHTSLRQSQVELEQTVVALERSNAQLEDFAHAASHDMKEPIRKILTFADRLKQTLFDRMTPTEKNLFERVEVSAGRLQLLVDDLLEFSHVSEAPQQTESINLNEKIKKVMSDLELFIEEKSAQLVLHPLPVIQGNRRQMQQLFQNLVGNALKYSKPGVSPIVEIRASQVTGRTFAEHVPADVQDHPFHLIEVVDNGIGFEQEYAEQIFKMFHRLHGKAEYSGTGVGLAIVRKVVQNHKGYIWAESEPDKGATFKILFPVG